MNVITELKYLLNEPLLIVEEEVQSLWSGYGQIIRCKSRKLNGQSEKSYIVKVIAPANASNHPRGWNTSTSHERKVKSYQVETNFYQHLAHLTDKYNKVPKLIASKVSNDFTLLVMEDLDESGYFVRKTEANWQSLSLSIRWLAYFHARFIGNKGCC